MTKPQTETGEKKERDQRERDQDADKLRDLMKLYIEFYDDSKSLNNVSIPLRELPVLVRRGLLSLHEASQKWRHKWPWLRRAWQSWTLQKKAGRFWQLDHGRLERSATINVKALAAMFSIATACCDDYGLFLHGATGRGKTFAAIQGARAVIGNGFDERIRFVTAEDMKAVYSAPHVSSEAKKEFTAELLDVGLLIIDDIGLPTFSPAFAQRFASLIDEIYVAGYPVLWLTAQCDSEQLRRKWHKDNPDMIQLTDRTVRRINELCEPMNFNG